MYLYSISILFCKSVNPTVGPKKDLLFNRVPPTVWKFCTLPENLKRETSVCVWQVLIWFDADRASVCGFTPCVPFQIPWDNVHNVKMIMAWVFYIRNESSTDPNPHLRIPNPSGPALSLVLNVKGPRKQIAWQINIISSGVTPDVHLMKRLPGQTTHGWQLMLSVALTGTWLPCQWGQWRRAMHGGSFTRDPVLQTDLHKAHGPQPSGREPSENMTCGAKIAITVTIMVMMMLRWLK